MYEVSKLHILPVAGLLRADETGIARPQTDIVARPVAR